MSRLMNLQLGVFIKRAGEWFTNFTKLRFSDSLGELLTDVSFKLGCLCRALKKINSHIDILDIYVVVYVLF